MKKLLTAPGIQIYQAGEDLIQFGLPCEGQKYLFSLGENMAPNIYLLIRASSIKSVNSPKRHMKQYVQRRFIVIRSNYSSILHQSKRNFMTLSGNAW